MPISGSTERKRLHAAHTPALCTPSFTSCSRSSLPLRRLLASTVTGPNRLQMLSALQHPPLDASRRVGEAAALLPGRLPRPRVKWLDPHGGAGQKRIRHVHQPPSPERPSVVHSWHGVSPFTVLVTWSASPESNRDRTGFLVHRDCAARAVPVLPTVGNDRRKIESPEAFPLTQVRLSGIAITLMLFMRRLSLAEAARRETHDAEGPPCDRIRQDDPPAVHRGTVGAACRK